MPLDVLHWWRDPRMGQVLDVLGEVQRQLTDLTREQTAMSDIVDELRTALEAQQETVESVITLLASLTSAVEDNVDDPDALREIIDDVRANTRQLADAVLTYTPSESGDEEPPAGEYQPPEGNLPPTGGGDGGGAGSIDYGTDG